MSGYVSHHEENNLSAQKVQEELLLTQLDNAQKKLAFLLTGLKTQTHLDFTILEFQSATSPSGGNWGFGQFMGHCPCYGAFPLKTHNLH